MRRIRKIINEDIEFVLEGILDGKIITGIEYAMGNSGFYYEVSSGLETVCCVDDYSAIVEMFEDGIEIESKPEPEPGETDIPEILGKYSSVENHNYKYGIGTVINGLSIAYIQKEVSYQGRICNYYCRDNKDNMIVVVNPTNDVIAS